jgi:hypothetical protein
MSYTSDDVIEYWKNFRPAYKTRERDVLDPRNYIVALLYYKFRFTEHELQSIMGMHHSTVNHAKKHPYDLIRIKEATFMRNTAEVRELFPFDFPTTNKEELSDERYVKKYGYTINFDKKLYQKIKAYSKVKELDPRTALRNLIQKALALWEE